MAKIRIYKRVELGASKPLKDFITELQIKLTEIPDDCKDRAYISFDTDSSYGEYSATAEITYLREETEAEVAARIDLDKKREENIRIRELKTLEELKRKYADGVG
jgi:hypothetical protein